MKERARLHGSTYRGRIQQGGRRPTNSAQTVYNIIEYQEKKEKLLRASPNKIHGPVAASQGELVSQSILHVPRSWSRNGTDAEVTP